ncbi:PadR family transcriptional regulator [Candidatus Avoscillospira sp. LCP25S3_F1]|uniref:PadR family transcriptional regulator n=1 Tax=Candidatus Avoscillospira sp. LCP25S3_F1 TaxID=3438825 RepID=UPI003F9066A7
MLNMSDMIRGYTDTIILAQLLRHDSYGYELNKAVAQASGGLLELKEATLYTTFRRLESAGCIRSYWGDETTGARRRYYAITELGRALYRENCADWQTFKTIIDTLLQGEEEP